MLLLFFFFFVCSHRPAYVRVRTPWSSKSEWIHPPSGEGQIRVDMSLQKWVKEYTHSSNSLKWKKNRRVFLVPFVNTSKFCVGLYFSLCNSTHDVGFVLECAISFFCVVWADWTHRLARSLLHRELKALSATCFFSCSEGGGYRGRRETR